MLAAIRVANTAAAMITYFMICLSVLRRLNFGRILERPCEEQFASAQIGAAFLVGQKGWSIPAEQRRLPAHQNEVRGDGLCANGL
jgi:hypothetical protein